MKIEWLNNEMNRGRLTRGWLTKETRQVYRAGGLWWFEGDMKGVGFWTDLAIECARDLRLGARSPLPTAKVVRR